MNILEVRPVTKNDIAAKRNPEIVPKRYFNAIFERNEKTYTATIRISTKHIALCLNEDNKPVKLKEESQIKLIQLIEEYNNNLENKNY